MEKIYLSNWDSKKKKGCHGPGRILSIAVLTSPHAEVQPPDGIIPLFTPRAIDFVQYKGNEIDIETYRKRFLEKVVKSSDLYIQRDHTTLSAVMPGKLMWQPWSFFESENEQPVKDGDTLCCTCSLKKAAKGECHRVWVAELLREAGWKVILDGKELEKY